MEDSKKTYKTGMPRLLELAATKKPLVIAEGTEKVLDWNLRKKHYKC